MHALRDIGCDEELTIAYVAGAEAGSRAHRHALLQRKYSFTCACDVCCLHGLALELSDRRQQRLAQIHTELASGAPHSGKSAAGGTGIAREGGHGNDPNNIAGALEVLVVEHLQLMSDERLPEAWGRAGMFLLVAQMVTRGDHARAAAWARRGARAASVALGDDSSAFCKFRDVAEVLENG